MASLYEYAKQKRKSEQPVSLYDHMMSQKINQGPTKQDDDFVSWQQRSNDLLNRRGTTEEYDMLINDAKQYEDYYLNNKETYGMDNVNEALKSLARYTEALQGQKQVDVPKPATSHPYTDFMDADKNIKQQMAWVGQQEYNKLLNRSPEDIQKEIDSLNVQLDSTGSYSPGQSRGNQPQQDTTPIQNRLVQLRRAADQLAYDRSMSVTKDKDFQKYVETGKKFSVQNGFANDRGTKHAYINGNKAEGVQSDNQNTYQIYDYMTDEERSVYNYLLAKDGEQKAFDFLEDIEETLNARMGTAVGNTVAGTGGLGGVLAKGAFAGYAGFDQFLQGTNQLFNTEATPISPAQFASPIVRESIDTPDVLGLDIGKTAYDLISTTANMAPSILVGAVLHPAAGAALMGASAKGNAYNQALKQGYEKGQAELYSVLIGASETTLQYLLGGISNLGGKLTNNAVAKLLSKIDSALFRAAGTLGTKMVSEGTEEYLQDILDPVFRNMIFNEDNQIDLLSEDAIYSGILGALSAGFLEAGPTIADNIKPSVKPVQTEQTAQAEQPVLSEPEEALPWEDPVKEDIPPFKPDTKKPNRTAVYNGSPVSISGISNSCDAALIVKLDDGVTANMTDLQIDDLDTEDLLLRATQYDTKAADAFVRGYNTVDVTPEQYQQGFDSIYQAALKGVDPVEAIQNSIYAREYLSPTAQRIAYGAGEIVVQKPGVVKAYSIKPSKTQKQQIQTLDAFGKLIGRTIRVVDSIPSTKDGQSSVGNAMYDNGVYTIALNGIGKAYMYFAMHESIHDIKQNNPDGYKRIESVVMDVLSTKGDILEARLDILRQLYKNASDDVLREELVSNTVPVILSDEQTGIELANRMAQEDHKTQGLFVKLMNAIKSMLQKAYNVLKEQKSWEQMKLIEGDQAALEQIRTVYLDAVKGMQTATDEQAETMSTPAEPMFSLQDTSPVDIKVLEEENAQLKATVDLLKQEFELTKGHRISRKAVDKLAKQFLQETKSAYDEGLLSDNLYKLFDYIANSEHPVWDEVKGYGIGMAKAILEESSEKDMTMYNETQEVRHYLRSVGIMFNDTQKAEAANMRDSFLNYRRSVIGSVNIVNQGLPLDVAWQELSDMNPALFPADTADADMPRVLFGAVQDMKPRYINPYGYDMDGAAADLFVRMYDAYFDVPEVKTFADKQQSELDAVKLRLYNRLEKVREDTKVRYEKKIQALKDKMQEQNKTQKENSERSKKVDRIRTVASDLRTYLERPSMKEGKYVPEFLKDIVLDVLSGIDFIGIRGGQSKQRSWVDALDALYREVSNYTDANSSDENVRSKVKNADRYQSMHLAVRAEFLPVLESLRDSAKQYQAETLYTMPLEDLQKLEFIMVNIKHAVRNANRFIKNQRYEYTSDAGEALLKHEKTAKQYRNWGALNQIKDFFKIDTMDSFTFGDALGEAGQSIMQSISDGLLQTYSKVREAEAFMKKLYKDIKVVTKDIRNWNKETHTFKLDNGTEVIMSTTQIMEMYALSNREQGLQHLLYGGMVLEDIRTDKKMIENEKNGSIQLTMQDIQNITAVLSDQQRNMMDRLQKFLSTVAAGWGNEVTQNLYEMDFYKEEFYWTIRSSAHSLDVQDPAKDRAFNAVMNSSFTKSTNQYAKNPIYIGDAFQTFSNHVTQMAVYNGLSIPIDDAMKFLNFRMRNTKGQTVDNASTRWAMMRLLGKGAQEFYVNYIKDLNGLNSSNYSTALQSKLISRYKRAAVAAKLRVIVQQPTSMFRASSMISMRYLAAARLHKNTIQEMQKNALIAWWKSKGNYEVGVGRSLRSIIVGDDTFNQQAGNIAMKPAGFMDDISWGVIWEAVKLETRHNSPDLKGEAFMNAVVERFTDIVNRTQVVDSVAHRPQVMRSKDLLVQGATSFMSEPMKSVNMVRSSVINSRGKTKAVAGKMISGAVLAWFGSQVLNAAVLALHDTFRDRDEEDEFIEMYLEKLRDQLQDNLNPLNSILFVKDFVSLLQGYDISRMDTAAMAELIRVANKWMKILDGTNTQPAYSIISDSVKAVSMLTGSPAGGFLSSAETLINGIVPGAVNQWKGKNTTAGDQYKAAYNAMKNKDAAQLDLIKKALLRSHPGKNALDIDALVNMNVAKILQDDPRIAQAYNYRKKANTTEYKKLQDAFVSEGFSVEIFRRAVNQYQNKAELDYKPSGSDKPSAMYSYDDLFTAIRNASETGDYTDLDNIYNEIINTSMAQDPKKSVRSVVSGEFKDEYVDAIESENKALSDGLAKVLKDRFDYTDDDLTGFVSERKYDRLREAIDESDRDAANEYIKELRALGKEDSAIATSVSAKYKKLFLQYFEHDEKDKMQSLAKMLMRLNLYRENGTPYYDWYIFDEWIDDYING